MNQTTEISPEQTVTAEPARKYVPLPQHTPAPWNLHPSLNMKPKPHLVGGRLVEPFWSFSRTIAVGETTIAEVTGWSPEGGGWPTAPIEQVEANARRIIACVNACEGLSTEDLEAGAVALAFKKAWPDDATAPILGTPSFADVLPFALSALVDRHEGVVELSSNDLLHAVVGVLQDSQTVFVLEENLTLRNFCVLLHRLFPVLLSKHGIKGNRQRRQQQVIWKFEKEKSS